MGTTLQCRWVLAATYSGAGAARSRKGSKKLERRYPGVDCRGLRRERTADLPEAHIVGQLIRKVANDREGSDRCLALGLPIILRFSEPDSYVPDIAKSVRHFIACGNADVRT